MRTILRLMLPSAAAVLVLSGCGSPISVHTDHDPQVNFTALKTWAWSSKKSLTPGNPDRKNPLLETRLNEAVERELAAKGFQKVSPGSADFIVSYAGAVNRKLQTQVIDNYYGYPGYGWYDYPRYYGPPSRDVIITEYEQGTLVLDIMNRKTGKLVWRGTARATLLENPTPERSTARINEAVRKILAGFPPKS